MKRIKEIKENEEFIFGNNVWNLSFEGTSVKLTRVRLTNTKAPKKGFIPPTLKEVEEFFASKGYSKEHAKKVYEHYSLGEPPWTDSHGTPVKSWRQKMNINWLQKEEGKVKSTNPKQTIDFFNNNGN